MNVQMPEIIALLALMLDDSKHLDSCTLKIIRTKFFPNLSELFDVCFLRIKIGIMPINGIRQFLFFEIVCTIDVVHNPAEITSVLHG